MAASIASSLVFRKAGATAADGKGAAPAINQQKRPARMKLVLGCLNNRYLGRRVRARGLQARVGRVPSRGATANLCNQALVALPREAFGMRGDSSCFRALWVTDSAGKPARTLPQGGTSRGSIAAAD